MAAVGFTLRDLCRTELATRFCYDRRAVAKFLESKVSTGASTLILEISEFPNNTV